MRGQAMRPASVYFRPMFSTAGDALAFAVEFHGAFADCEVGGRLNEAGGVTIDGIAVRKACTKRDVNMMI
jgi:hypothetical protein